MARVALFFPFLFLLALFPAIAYAAALAPRTSSTPSCSLCPTTDEAGFPLADHSGTGVLFCSYPAFSGEDPNDFFCTYNSVTGALITDNDAGFCPSSAQSTVCTPSKRDNIVKVLKRRAEARAEARAAQPQATRPNYMDARSALGKKKRAQ